MVTETYPAATEASLAGDGVGSGRAARSHRQNERRHRMKTTKVHRPVILITAAALVLGLGAVGAAAAWGNRSDRSTGVSAAASRTGSATVEPIVAHPSGSASPAPSRPSPSVKPSPDPTRLADGVYPTYVRGVEVQGSTITVDVLQTFFGADAHRAATEDGVDWGDVRYDPEIGRAHV